MDNAMNTKASEMKAFDLPARVKVPSVADAARDLEAARMRLRTAEADYERAVRVHEQAFAVDALNQYIALNSEK